jgi:MoaA/NifB/PqqE/SkfB family radical SAM enzyme
LLAKGHSADEYSAPLFVAWQLTNRCTARCIACCEESGPYQAWNDELSRDEAVTLARQIAGSGVRYVAFGGGEPLGVPHCWEVFEHLVEAGVALKLETDGRYLDENGADRLVALSPQCVQISVDGAMARTHEEVRPGSSFVATIASIQRLTARGYHPQLVFVPNRLNIHEALAVYDLAAALDCETFVTGPLMRIGRAANAWEHIACSELQWQETVVRLHEHARDQRGSMKLSIYPWDILTEMQRRLESPQAMLLIVPNGKVKLLNALPFSPADLRRDTLARAWQAYRDAWRLPEVSEFIAACRNNPALLRHANATWSMDLLLRQGAG